MKAEIEQHLPAHLWPYIYMLVTPGKSESLTLENEAQFIHCLGQYLSQTSASDLDGILKTMAAYVRDGKGRVEIYDDGMVCFRPATHREIDVSEEDGRTITVESVARKN